MAYPTVSAGYGLLPQNLIGGQVFAGSTRMIPIANAYSTSMFYGDLVQFANTPSTGSLIVTSTSTPSTSQAAQAAVAGTVGIFLGCEYTLPAGSIYGKQRYQYWPASTATNDAVAYVYDDPDAVFKSAVYAQTGSTNSNTTTTLGYMSPAFVGTNVYYVAGNGGNTSTGNSLGGVSGNTPGSSNGTGNILKTAGNTAPFRVVGLVNETTINVSTTLASAASSTNSLTVASATGIYPGMQVVIPAATANGQAGFNNYVTAVSGTTITIASNVSAASGAVVSFIGWSEVLVKMNFGYHSYYNASSVVVA
jgi:hypothetical protein